MEDWVERNGCDPDGVTEDLPDEADDDLTSTLTTWTGCDEDAEVRHIKVQGGGHSWPGGSGGTDKAGPITEDFEANEVFLDFFDQYSIP